MEPAFSRTSYQLSYNALPYLVLQEIQVYGLAEANCEAVIPNDKFYVEHVGSNHHPFEAWLMNSQSLAASLNTASLCRPQREWVKTLLFLIITSNWNSSSEKASVVHPMNFHSTNFPFSPPDSSQKHSSPLDVAFVALCLYMNSVQDNAGRAELARSCSPPTILQLLWIKSRNRRQLLQT